MKAIRAKLKRQRKLWIKAREMLKREFDWMTQESRRRMDPLWKGSRISDDQA